MKQLPNEYVGESLSHGTMRTEDLIPYFMDFLNDVKEKCEIVKEVEDIQKEVDELEMIEYEGYSGPYYNNQEDANYILNEDIWDVLNDIAPEFTCFGSTEGDGSDYGFWTSEESLSEHIYETIQNLDSDSYGGNSLDLFNVRQELEILVELLLTHGY